MSRPDLNWLPSDVRQNYSRDGQEVFARIVRNELQKGTSVPVSYARGYVEAEKFNPNHDSKGRFASSSTSPASSSIVADFGGTAEQQQAYQAMAKMGWPVTAAKAGQGGLIFSNPTYDKNSGTELYRHATALKNAPSIMRTGLGVPGASVWFNKGPLDSFDRNYSSANAHFVVTLPKGMAKLERYQGHYTTVPVGLSHIKEVHVYRGKE